jgi:hypothetical protein
MPRVACGSSPDRRLQKLASSYSPERVIAENLLPGLEGERFRLEGFWLLKGSSLPKWAGMVKQGKEAWF